MADKSLIVRFLSNGLILKYATKQLIFPGPSIQSRKNKIKSRQNALEASWYYLRKLKKRKKETLPVVSLNCIPTLFPGRITLECKLLFEVSHISPPAEDYAALRNSSRITDVAAENLRPLSRPFFSFLPRFHSPGR